MKFKIPPSCELSHLIIDITTHLGLNAEQDGSGSEMLLRAWDKSVQKRSFFFVMQNIKASFIIFVIFPN